MFIKVKAWIGKTDIALTLLLSIVIAGLLEYRYGSWELLSMLFTYTYSLAVSALVLIVTAIADIKLSRKSWRKNHVSGYLDELVDLFESVGIPSAEEANEFRQLIELLYEIRVNLDEMHSVAKFVKGENPALSAYIYTGCDQI